MAPIIVRLPGAFRELIDSLQRSFAAVAPGIELVVPPPKPSGMLVQDVLEGMETDVVVSANRAFLELLATVGASEPPLEIAGNRLALLVRPEVAERVHGLADLAHPGLRVAVSQPVTDPCGQYVLEAFRRAGVDTALQEKSRQGLVVRTRGSADLPTVLREGRADVAVLYVSETVRGVADLIVRTLEPPLDLADAIRFCVAAVYQRGQVRAEARAFVDFLRGEAGQAFLASAGFLPLATRQSGDRDGRS